MSRRKEACICGFESRSDYMRKHTETCKARHTIVKLRDENLVLKSKVNFFTELQQNSHGDEITYLRNQLDLKNKIIQQKDQSVIFFSNAYQFFGDKVFLNVCKV